MPTLSQTSHVSRPGDECLGNYDPNEQLSLIIALYQTLSEEQYENYQKDLNEFSQTYSLTWESSFNYHYKLIGSVANLEKAFQVNICQFKDSENRLYYANKGDIVLPESWKDVVIHVFGLDNKPVFKPRSQFRKISQSERIHPSSESDQTNLSRDVSLEPRVLSPWLATEIAGFYDFPDSRSVSTQRIGIIELGGGYYPSDISTYFYINGVTGPPNLVNVSYNGAFNNPGIDINSDTEVTLDTEIIAVLAPDAQSRIYFAPNSFTDFYGVIQQAVLDGCNIISVSWGAPEDNIPQSLVDAFNMVTASAASFNVNIFCASGDRGAFDGTGQLSVDFPSSSPSVIGCGGTTIDVTGSTITSEVVWNNDPLNSATGGGISEKNATPSFQNRLSYPLNGFRGVPDVAGAANPNTGFTIYYNGGYLAVGGTSAVSPLYSGLLGRINALNGTNVGFLGPRIYANPGAFNDITSGNNGYYNAGIGWDACTGLGSPKGTVLSNSLRNLTPATANFVGTPLVGSSPLTVNFYDQSVGNASSWFWNFGDGNTSTDQNPIHTYNNPGTYDVVLTVNGSSTLVKPNYIQVDAIVPVANFTASGVTGYNPLTVNFTDLSLNDPVFWAWEFGDGGNSNLQNPTYVYLTPGVYTVSLVATNSAGENKMTKTNYITVFVAVPVADFTATPLTGPAPLTVNFSNASTGVITSRLWNFGNGTGTAINPTRIYNTPGIYTVSLTVANSSGSNTKTRTDYIVVTEAVVANFTGTPTSGPGPLIVNFTDSSTGNPTSWDWNFGDGATGSDQNPTHTYLNPGAYTVSLTASNGGDSDTLVRTNYINVDSLPPPPVVDFSGSPTSGNTPLFVQFTDSSSNNPNSWNWDFGDGGNSTLQNPDHTYLNAGTYTVSLAAGNAGGTGSTSKSDYITVLEPLVADFVGNPLSGPDPLIVFFTDLSSGNPSSWLWNFGDGATGDAQNPNHAYVLPGTYTVSLTINGSVSETKVNYIQVNSLAPVADFSGNPLNGPASLTVNFTDLSTGNPTSWFWNFGDGDTSTDQNPIHEYLDEGVYTVSLSITNEFGFDSTIKNDYITVGPALPIANFSADPVSGINPLTVNFTDLSVGDIDSWLWDFGDGATGSGPNPSHTYLNPGTYTVSLTVTNSSGSDTDIQPDLITVQEESVTADFEGNPLSGSSPLTVNFTDLSTGNPTSWLWDFGDGATGTDQNPTHVYVSSGSYNVSLFVSNSSSNSLLGRNSYILVNPPVPVVDFVGFPLSGTAPLFVDFIDASTNSPTAWLWDFGDGNTSALQNPNHNYTVPGIYTVSLTASNSGGSGSDTKIDYITVDPQPVVADFSANPLSGNLPLMVTFTDESTGNPTSWFWDFGDGNTSTLQNPVHTYLVSGSYTVSLTVSNSVNSDTKIEPNYIAVDILPVVADFVGTPLTGFNPLMVTFTDLSTGNPTSWFWDFGDGNTSTLQNPVHTYLNPGSYTVSLTASSNVDSDTKIEPNYITVNALPVVADFVGTPLTGFNPLMVTFTDLSTGNPISWFWDFGDGNTSTLQNPVHTYLNPGSYTVSLTASSNVDSDTKIEPNYITVNPIPLTANFSANPTSGPIPLTVNFTDLSTGNPTSWFWDFGDGNTSTDQNPTHTYLNPGSYTVTLTVSNGSETSTKISPNFILVSLPNPLVANFTSNTTGGKAPLKVKFTDLSTGNIISWLWNFGDGKTSTDQNPKHLYKCPGYYTVSLTVSDGISTSTVVKVDYIAVHKYCFERVSVLAGNKIKLCVKHFGSKVIWESKGLNDCEWQNELFSNCQCLKFYPGIGDDKREYRAIVLNKWSGKYEVLKRFELQVL